MTIRERGSVSYDNETMNPEAAGKVASAQISANPATSPGAVGSRDPQPWGGPYDQVAGAMPAGFHVQQGQTPPVNPAAPQGRQPYGAYPSGQPAAAPYQASMPSNGQATAAMVCGILGLVLCLVPPVGGILALVAVVLALLARQKPASGSAATAGLVMGIIGVILGILFTAFTVWLVLGYSNVQVGYDSALSELADELDEGYGGDGAMDGTFDDADDQAAYDAAVERLDMVCNPSSEARENLAHAINDAFLQTSGMDMKDIGLDSAGIVDWVVQDASYRVTRVDTWPESGIGVVYYTSNTRDIDDLIDDFTDRVHGYTQTDDFAHATDDEKKQKFAQLMDEAMAGEREMDAHHAWLDMERFAGEWAPSQDSLNRLPDEFYDTTW